MACQSSIAATLVRDKRASEAQAILPEACYKINERREDTTRALQLLMRTHLTVKTAFKRGVLVAAANWQVTAIQFVADSTVKLMLTVPIVGGVGLVGLVLGRDLPELLGPDLRSSLANVAAALWAEPLALAAFLLSFAIVGIAGSGLLFLTKGGTVLVLAAGEGEGAAIEEPPLRFGVFWTAAQFSLERFHDGCTHVFGRYLRLGLALIAVYIVTAVVYLFVLLDRLPAALTPDSDVAWTVTAGVTTSVLAAWITVINFFYSLMQMVIVLDDCSVGQAGRRVVRLLRAEAGPVWSVFGLVLLLVASTTVISIVAATGLGLIAFVPLVGLAVVPLQLLAWLFRGLVFQFLELSALGAYLNIYRRHLDTIPDGSGPASA
jgi:hypothetical protein